MVDFLDQDRLERLIRQEARAVVEESFVIENKFEAKIEARVPVSSTAGPDVHADVGRFVEDEISPSATGATTSGD
jgi:hypothetical protein